MLYTRAELADRVKSAEIQLQASQLLIRNLVLGDVGPGLLLFSYPSAGAYFGVYPADVREALDEMSIGCDAFVNGHAFIGEAKLVRLGRFLLKHYGSDAGTRSK